MFLFFTGEIRAFIQHPDELASGYVLVVPPGQKTKNHKKKHCPAMLSFFQLMVLQQIQGQG